MNWLHEIAYFFGGAFLTNALPHLVAGLQGKPFQSPFAHPPGQGLSTSRTNALWGAANVALAWLLLGKIGAFDIRAPLDAGAAFAGGFILAVLMSQRFGRFNGGNSPSGDKAP
ncbi:hypothetical protein [Phenylobacterium sp.]|uniref:hypothetical protein n=1 Tax=Phenylobacterium sp. TaxID=1871053 RepID=UPI00122B3D7E|nr:hypothetical protein [Phenylobacterium sp.]THD59108.1 MAG: hypothetical protein E8A49_17040 [Phenylobacterium sp.]